MTASHKVLWGLAMSLVAAKIIELLVHVPFRSASQQALFSWKSVAFFVTLTLLGAAFAHIVGFPAMWEKKIGNRQRVWLPLLLGIVLGIGLLAVDRVSGFSHLMAVVNGQPSLGVPFPYSLLVQLFVALCSAVLYNLFAISFTVWFFGTLLLSRHWPSQVFWALAILVSSWEPLTMATQKQWALVRVAPPTAALVGLLVLVYVMDLAGAVLLRRFGFVAALVMRVSAIVVWHIIGRF
jgi:hypothetical protein